MNITLEEFEAQYVTFMEKCQKYVGAIDDTTTENDGGIEIWKHMNKLCSSSKGIKTGIRDRHGVTPL
jgi:hypothetical protein